MRVLLPTKRCAWLPRRKGEVKNWKAVGRNVGLCAPESIKCTFNSSFWVIFNTHRFEENTHIYVEICSQVVFIHSSVWSIFTAHIWLKDFSCNLDSPKGGAMLLECATLLQHKALR